MALIGLHSGQKIIKNKNKKGFKITRTQTAKQAYNAIVKKYGKVIPNAKYFHVSKGEWRKYSLSNDKKRTGKTTSDIKKWRKQPHKLDYKGIDTKESKKTLPVSMIKKPSKPKRRIMKPQKMKQKPILKKINANGLKKYDLGNGYTLTTLYAINEKRPFIEYVLYKNGKRVDPVLLDESVFSDDQYTMMERIINNESKGSKFILMGIQEGKLKNLIPKNVWYTDSPTYDKRDQLKSIGMIWEPSLKRWASLKKPKIEGMKFKQIKTYKTKEGWTWY